MELTDAKVMLWLGHFLWPFLRITGLFLTAPLYGSALLPASLRATLAAAYAAALALWLPNLPAFPGDPASAIYAGICQITYGALLGMVMQIIIAGIASAGEIAGLSMGLSFAELQFQEVTGATPVLYDILFWTGFMGYMLAGGPIWLFAALAHSFDHGTLLPNLSQAGQLAAMGGTLLSAAVTLALPVIAVSLCVNLTVGLTTVFAPQMNLLTIGFPLLILAGLWMFGASLFYLPAELHDLLATAQHSLTGLLPHG
jgi:flagellar biosynthetic protein FliR